MLAHADHGIAHIHIGALVVLIPLLIVIFLALGALVYSLDKRQQYATEKEQKETKNDNSL